MHVSNQPVTTATAVPSEPRPEFSEDDFKQVIQRIIYWLCLWIFIQYFGVDDISISLVSLKCNNSFVFYNKDYKQRRTSIVFVLKYVIDKPYHEPERAHAVLLAFILHIDLQCLFVDRVQRFGFVCKRNEIKCHV